MARRWLANGLLAVVAGVLGFGVVSAIRRSDPPPELVFVQDVPADVRRETDATWRRFRGGFEGRSHCWGDVRIELVRAVDDGDARYVVADSRIEIQIPTTPARYRESLVHELAHHVERTCSEFETLQAALRPMLDGDDRDWYEGPIWEEIPSERFAEAVVEFVNGERIRHEDEVPVDAAVVELIARWGAGEDVAAGD